MPSGSAGRRQRPAAPEPPSRSAGNGGASLFTPAYRVSHAAAGTRPTSQSPASQSPAGGATRAPAAGDRADSGQGSPAYSWADADADQDGLGYRSGYDNRADPAWPGDSDQGAGYGRSPADQPGNAATWPAGTASGRSPVTNAVRGFPPEPGEPLPVYPPGPFAAWNRGSQDRGRATHRGGPDRAIADGGIAPGPDRAWASADPAGRFAAATITPDEFDTDYSLPAIKDPAPSAAGRPPAQDRKPASGQGRQGGTTRQARPAAKAGPAGRSRSRTKHQPAWLAIGAAAVIVAAVAAILVATSLSSPSPPPKAGGPTLHASTSPSPTPPAGPWQYIGSRTSDSQPLTMHELYPLSFSSAGVVYTRAKSAKGTNCQGALIGSALQAAVKAASCTQAVRATYVSQSGGVMATIGVFNLKSSAAASKAALKASHSEFVSQLRPKTGPASKIGQGTGLEEALVKGHYLILCFAQFTSLRAPKTQADRARLESFLTSLVKQTENVGLSYRMVDGKPMAPA